MHSHRSGRGPRWWGAFRTADAVLMHPVMVGPVKGSRGFFLEGLLLLRLSIASLYPRINRGRTRRDQIRTTVSSLLFAGWIPVWLTFVGGCLLSTNARQTSNGSVPRVQRGLPSALSRRARPPIDPWSSSFQVRFRPTPPPHRLPIHSAFRGTRLRHLPGRHLSTTSPHDPARYSGSRAAAQMKPANSRATATTTSCLHLPREISRR